MLNPLKISQAGKTMNSHNPPGIYKRMPKPLTVSIIPKHKYDKQKMLAAYYETAVQKTSKREWGRHMVDFFEKPKNSDSESVGYNES
jgi:hypothetical protein